MKKLILALLIIFNLQIFAQNVRIPEILPSGFKYNMLIGKDYQKTKTTVRGFGSGIYDFSGSSPIFYFWIYKPSKRFIGVGLSLGFHFQKFKFVDNYLINSDYIFTPDTNSNHLYSNNFFSRDQSKLVIKYFSFPIIFYFPIAKWIAKADPDVFGIFIEPFYDVPFYSYHKLMFHDKTQNNKLKKIKTDNPIISQMIEQNNYGATAGLKFKYFSIYARYYFSKLFTNDKNFDVNILNVGINLSSAIFWKKLKNKNNFIEDKNPFVL